ncbi:BREX-3 system P-loop-containing protein BrxF [Gilvimarinus sp. 2_MG-2023]|uniref:BREX-3 system P-loop-containing protein BrxF n=1 Tax=Gilvimarinus sp. 2_MG-2023 TaxID=3062666 RepID=UPI0034A17C80
MLYLSSLEEALGRAALNRTRLICISSEQAASSSFDDTPKWNLNKLVSEHLMSTPKSEWTLICTSYVESLVQQQVRGVVLLIGLEVLFDRSLAVDPLKLLMKCARTKTIIVSWPGEINSNGLSYANVSHPEYRMYKPSELDDVIFLSADAQLHLRDINEIR